MTREGEELVHAVESHKGIGALDSQELLKATFDPWDQPAKGFGPGGVGRFRRPVRVFVENLAFNPTKRRFEIAKIGEEILAALEEHQVMVLVGTTGSGKSTFVPWLLLTGGEPGGLSKWAQRGPICVTQPRIQATRQVPKFIANQLNGTSLGVGAQIGFSHSGADEYDRRTRLIFKTDGKLINDIVSGAVANYSIIMIDEAHERSVNIDLILGLLKDQLYLYPHLRLIIASATIDHETFIGFYGGKNRVPFLHSEGIQHPVHKHWWGDSKDLWWKPVNKGQLPARQQLPRSIGELVTNICQWLDGLSCEERSEEDGHILVFLPGSKEIDQTVSLINSLHLPNVIALPLYSQRPLDEQEAALNPIKDKHPHIFGKRRVVVSTNVAETSLTVEGIKHVIETGYIKESYWNPLRQVLELQTIRHSKAGCKQRWGRAGRTCPGHAYMFYTEQEFLDFPDDSTPEIARASLDQVLLTAKAAGVRTQTGALDLDFDWIPLKREPDRVRFRQELSRAHASLIQQGAIDQDGDLTRAGLEMRGMPADLHVARICMEAERHGMGIEAATLLPFLRLNFGLPSLLLWDHAWDSYQKYEIRQRQIDLVWGCRDDIDLYVKLWLLWEEKVGQGRDEWAMAAGLDVQSFQKSICDERRKLLESIKDWRKAEDRPPAVARLDSLRALIAHCLPTEIYIPVEAKREEVSDRPRTRFNAPDLLQWQAFWEEGGLYQEYDDDLAYDESYTAQKGRRSGVYTRLDPSSQAQSDADQLEIAPTSICFGRDDQEMLVACQRRANFNHPVRTKVVGMNNVQIDPGWLSAIRGSLADRCFLFARLSRLRDPLQHVLTTIRLLLPEALPRGSTVTAVVTGPRDGTSIPVNIALDLKNLAKAAHLDREQSVKGRALIMGLQSELKQGDQLTAQVDGYELEADGALCVLLTKRPSSDNAFANFRRRFRVGSSIEVEMVQVLDDPLGRSPMFLVRESVSGLEIPMADTDFCGDTVPRAFYGRRFNIGEQFEVRVEEVDAGLKRVRLSRGRKLLTEYLGMLGGEDSHLTKIEIKRTDALGVYVGIPGSERNSYIAFVRHPLWPAELSKERGSVHEARIRRFERQFSITDLKTLSRTEDPLPRELDLGIDCDLLLPLAYGRFAEAWHVGDSFSGAIVEKSLESGALLVALNSELKGMIFDSELGLDQEGKLRRARSYAPGDELKALIIRMNNQTKLVRLSLLRAAAPPLSLIGSTIEVVVLHTRPHFQEADKLELTCSFERKYAVRLKVPVSEVDTLRPQCMISVKVLKIDRTNLIDAEYLKLASPPCE
jgi:HrpA-like RNA helicase